eukprot:8868683-Lingulodinium_polyedra.AAC.1
MPLDHRASRTWPVHPPHRPLSLVPRPQPCPHPGPQGSSWWCPGPRSWPRRQGPWRPDAPH